MVHEVYCTASSSGAGGISCPCHTAMSKSHLNLRSSSGAKQAFPVTRLTITLVLNAMTAHCRLIDHQVGITYRLTCTYPRNESRRAEVLVARHAALHSIRWASVEGLPVQPPHRSRPLPAFLFFPTGCMHGICTCRSPWPHCIQVTLSLLSSTASLQLLV